MKNQRKTGLLISYFNFAISIAGNFWLTPALIRLLGDAQYGLYQIMRSMGGMLLMFNLGVSSMVARSIARAQVQNTDENQNTLTVGLMLSVVLALIVAAVSGAVYTLIPAFYQTSYTAAQLAQAQQVFGLFAAASVCHILTDAFSGCLSGREHFSANALVVTLKYVLRFGLLYGCVLTGADAAALAAVDLVVGAAGLLLLAGYALLVLKERPKCIDVRKQKWRGMFAFCAAVLMQEMVSQLNTHMDPILLGRLEATASTVTMYSSALVVYNLYHHLVSMIGGYYLARASRLVAQNATGSQLTEMLIPPGRFQAAMAFGVIGGFALFGRSFIALWIGEKYLDAYGVILILMIPALIPLVQTSALSILDAQFKRMYRSVVLLLCTAVNVAVSLWLMRWIGHWGAAVGTAVSTLLGHGWLMNRFYARTIGLEVGRMFGQIFRPVLMPAFLAAALCLPLICLPYNWYCFLGQCVAFAAVYGLLLYVPYRKQKG